MSEGRRERQVNLNSFLLGLVMIGTGYVVKSSLDTREAVIPLKPLPQKMEEMAKELRNTVSREEFQQKMQEAEAKRQATDAKLAELSIEIVKLKAKPAFR